MLDATFFFIRASAAFVVGFIVPGFLLARMLIPADRPLRPALLAATSFLLSGAILFHVLFWIVVLGLPLRALVVWPAMVGVVVLLGWAAWRTGSGASPEPLIEGEMEPVTPVAGAMTFLVTLIGLLLFNRLMLWPLAGADTDVRWDYLATRILKYEGLDYYPPVRAEDFTRYFYVDGIPPLVSFTYWWMYASVGRHAAVLTGAPVIAQFSAILVFVLALGRLMHSRLAGIFAMAVLVSSSLATSAIAIGQETGLTTLSMVGMMYFLIAAKATETRWRWMVLAGLAAGVGALSREYGWAYLAVGLVAILWSRLGWRMAGVFALTMLLVAAPWYIRNLFRTGNPLYNARLGPFSVNPVHAGIMDLYRQTMGVSQFGLSHWGQAAVLLLKDAPLQCTIGLLAAGLLVRRWGFMTAGVGVVVFLWLLSVGYTSGGIPYSMRVLAPAVALLSVLAGVLLAGIARRPALLRACAGLLVCGCLWGALVAAFHPLTISRPVLVSWSDYILARPPPDSGWIEQMADKLPRETRVLTDNPYVAIALEDRGIGAVPVWSPEVSFLTDPALPGPQARQRLRDLGIFHVAVQNQLNLRYLVGHMPIYGPDSSAWNPIFEQPGEAWLLELPPVQP